MNFVIEKTNQQMREISSVLREIRLEKGVSQADIAKKTGLSKQMVSKIESVDGNPTLRTLIKYCNCIDVDLVELIESTRY